MNTNKSGVFFLTKPIEVQTFYLHKTDTGVRVQLKSFPDLVPHFQGTRLAVMVAILKEEATTEAIHC